MPTRGSLLRSSLASFCLASQSISALTSRASASGESTSTVPPELPNPRASHVSTLKPALRSGPRPTWPSASVLVLFGFVSREPPQPWPSSTVGAFLPAFAGKNDSWIFVPSKDVTVASRAWAAGATSRNRARVSGAASFTLGQVPGIQSKRAKAAVIASCSGCAR